LWVAATGSTSCADYTRFSFFEILSLEMSSGFLCYNICMGRNASDLLERSLDGARLELLHLLAYQASMLRMPLYLVGGVVRDILMERQLKDFDLVVEGDSATFAEDIVKKYGGRVLIHSKFGTATWMLNESTFKRLNVPMFQSPDSPLSFDLVSARSETYDHPGALPTVKRSKIDDDLRRRDFTINAMAIRLDGDHFGELFDPLDGSGDLENKLIRVLHPRSFIDDPTRILRAARYTGRYLFQLESETRKLINGESRAVLMNLSGERLRHEFDLMFEERNALAMLEELDQVEVLKQIHPVLRPVMYRSPLDYSLTDDLSDIVLPNMLSFHQTLGWIMWLISLQVKEIELIAKRLAFPSLLTKATLGAAHLYAEFPGHIARNDSQKTYYFDGFPLLSVYVVWVFASWDNRYRQILANYLSEWRHVKPHTNGYDLKKLGLEPGPKYAEILRQLRAAWLDGEVKTEAEEKELLNRLLTV
jgi:tRNA nucleotidyltransferase (CCA-adding enzyme)